MWQYQKSTVREKTGILFVEESIGILWCAGYAPKKCSIRRERIED